MSAPLIPRGRRPLGAQVSGYAAVWMYNLLGDRAPDSIRHHHAMGRKDIAQQIADAVADLREAARQHQAATGTTPVSVHENAEGSASSSPAVSGPVGSDSPGEVDVREAAAVLRVTPSRARQLLRAGDLAGRQDRTGRWSVDLDDLHRLEADRRITA